MLYKRRIGVRIIGFWLLWLLLPCPRVVAQAEQMRSKVFSLEEAVSFALQNYPAVRSQLERVAAARAGVGLARTSFLPRTDLLWQSNRATRNNVFGLLLPQSVISPISGPVLPTTSNSSVWSSAAGLLLSWEPFDFGYRRETVRAAQSAQSRVSAEADLTQFDVAVATTEAFLILLAHQQTVQAALANVERRQIFANAVHVLVDNQLRPGVDASRADAELAAAKIGLLQAEEAEKVSRVALAQAMGIAGTEVTIEPGPLLELRLAIPSPPSALSAHPLAAAGEASIKEVRARERVLDRAYYPRFNFQSTVYGRGSGAGVDGSTSGGLRGLGLEKSNWAVGLTINFPLFDFASIRARKEVEVANERAEAARYDQIIQDLTAKVERARAELERSRRVAEQTPIQLQAARATETQARARYQAGLATIVEVADAQRLLVQAEIDDALARLSVWRGFASLSAAQGDLQPFMQLLRGRPPGGP